MINFSIDYLTGQNSSVRKENASLSDSGSLSPEENQPSPVLSEEGSSSFSDDASLGKDSAGSSSPRGAGARSGGKPPHSYIALISMAILSTDDKKMLLSDIYNYIMEHFPYYNNKDKAWRNSIRHNLSLNECFVKRGRADNGKGNFWSVHPACIDDFANGDFRRRQARRRARKSSLTREGNTRDLDYRYNIGYVPMTTSTVAYPGYRPSFNMASPLYYQVPTTQSWLSPYQSQNALHASQVPTPGFSISPTFPCNVSR